MPHKEKAAEVEAVFSFLIDSTVMGARFLTES